MCCKCILIDYLEWDDETKRNGCVSRKIELKTFYEVGQKSY